MKTSVACLVCIVIAFVGFQYYLHGGISHLAKPSDLLVKKEPEEKPKAKYPEALLPNTKGLAVPFAAKWNKAGEHPGTAVLTREGTLHPWHEKLYPGWKSDAVEHTELVLIVDSIKKKNSTRGEKTKKDLDKKANNKQGQQFWLDVWLVESSTGNEIASKRFRADREGKEALKDSELERTIPWEVVFEWMRSHLQDQAQPSKLSTSEK